MCSPSSTGWRPTRRRTLPRSRSWTRRERAEPAPPAAAQDPLHRAPSLRHLSSSQPDPSRLRHPRQSVVSQATVHYYGAVKRGGQTRAPCASHCDRVRKHMARLSAARACSQPRLDRSARAAHAQFSCGAQSAMSTREPPGEPGRDMVEELRHGRAFGEAISSRTVRVQAASLTRRAQRSPRPSADNAMVRPALVLATHTLHASAAARGTCATHARAHSAAVSQATAPLFLAANGKKKVRGTSRSVR